MHIGIHRSLFIFIERNTINNISHNVFIPYIPLPSKVPGNHSSALLANSALPLVCYPSLRLLFQTFIKIYVKTGLPILTIDCRVLH